MKPKVLYISYDGMTDQLGQSQVLPYLCGLSAMGYDFTLLSFEKKDKYKKTSTLISNICNDNNIKWVPEFFSSRPPVLSKIYDSWKMKRKAIKLQKEQQFDLVHCRSYVAAGAALSLYKKFKTPFLFDMRGFWADERVDFGQWNLKNPLMRFAYKTYKKKEKQFFAQSIHIISLTEKGKQELINNYNVAAEKVSVIPCCADLAHFDHNKITEADKQEARRSLGIAPGDIVVSYLGSLGGMYLTNEMLDFFKIFKQYEPKTKLLLISFSKKEDVMNAAAQRQIDNSDIIVRGSQRKDVPLFLSLSDLSLSFIMDKYSKKASSPTKQGEIMAMGIPVVCNDIGDIGMIMNDTGAGVLLKEFTDKGYRQAIDEWNKKKPFNKKMIRDAACKYYDLADGVKKYAAVYGKIIK